jgi:hypothetical protein
MAAPHARQTGTYVQLIFTRQQYSGGRMVFTLRPFLFRPLAGTAAFEGHNRWRALAIRAGNKPTCT